MIIFSKKIKKTTEIEFIKSWLIHRDAYDTCRYLYDTILVVVCFLSVTLVSGYRLHERRDRGPLNLIHSRRDGNFLTAEEIARRKAKYAVVGANVVTPAVLTRMIQKPIGISAKFVPLTVELRSASIE